MHNKYTHLDIEFITSSSLPANWATPASLDLPILLPEVPDRLHQRQCVGKASILEIGVLNIVLYHLLSPKIVPVIIVSTWIYNLHGYNYKQDEQSCQYDHKEELSWEQSWILPKAFSQCRFWWLQLTTRTAASMSCIKTK